MDGRLFIVSGKKTRAGAEYLESRVDASDLPFAGDATDLWTVRDYLKEASALSGADALVFFGAADAWEAETAGGETVFDRFGMRCVVRPRRALLTAEEGPILGKKAKRAFFDYVKAEHPEIGAEEPAFFDAERKMALFDSLRAAINPFSMVLEQQIAPPANSADLTELERLQYRVLGLVVLKTVLPGWA